MSRIFFATDIHGSQICWRKFVGAASFYKANILILGGDMTGKALVPIISEQNGSFSTDFQDNRLVLKNEEEASRLEKIVTDKGYYPTRIERSVYDDYKASGKLPSWGTTTFNSLMIERVRSWMNYADNKLKATNVSCFVCPGNDDMFEIDSVITEAKKVVDVEGKVLEVDGYELLGSGWSTPTPWKTFRECSEEELLTKIMKMADRMRNPSKSIFDLHDPPISSGLDEAPDLGQDMNIKYGGKVMRAVGSKAVRQAIEKYQPLAGLHGHIHESKGVVKIGRTVCVNPGSIYEEGALQGAVVDLEEGKVKKCYPTSG